MQRFLDGLAETVELFPTSPFYRFIYSWYLEKAGRREQSVDQLATVLVLDPTLESTLQLLEESYNNDEMVEAAEQLQILVRLSKTAPASIIQ